MNARRTPRVDLAILAAGVDQLPAYLRSGGVARPIVVTVDGEVYRPGISIGYLLELIRDLGRRAAELDPDQRARVDALARELEVSRAMHAADYAAHLRRELKSQLDGWTYYLDDCARGKIDCEADYPAEARARTRIALLLAESDARGLDLAAERARLAELDRRLDGLVQPGPYVGPAGEAGDYPEREYPWLYRRPRL